MVNKYLSIIFMALINEKDIDLSYIKNILYHDPQILSNTTSAITNLTFIHIVFPESLRNHESLASILGHSPDRNALSRFMHKKISKKIRTKLYNLFSTNVSLINDIINLITIEWNLKKGNEQLLHQTISSIGFKTTTIGEIWLQTINNREYTPAEIICFLILYSILDKSAQFLMVPEHRRNTITDNNKKLVAQVLPDSCPEETNLFTMGGLSFEYIPILASWDKDINEFKYGDIQFIKSSTIYKIPEVFESYKTTMTFTDLENIYLKNYEKKIRINTFEINNYGTFKTILFYYTPIVYSDFLLTNCILDEAIPGKNITYRQYLSSNHLDTNNYLSNIAGVGVFILTSDKRIIISKTSGTVSVNSNIYSYSSGGTMDLTSTTNPFNDAIRETYEEINLELTLDDLTLFSFGQESKLKYYQFSFLAKVPYTALEIIKNANMGKDYATEISRIESIPFDLKSVTEHFKQYQWANDAKSTLLTLLSKEFGKNNVELALNPEYYQDKYRSRMKHNWENRAKRQGVAAVLSTRFPSIDINKISNSYVNYVLNFIGKYDKKRILECGGGIGLFTKHFIQSAKFVTVVDLSSGMLERNKNYIGAKNFKNIEYKNCYIQDLTEDKKYDIIICSLVLTHNEQHEAVKIINKMKKLSSTIFLFEPIESSSQASNHSYAHSRTFYLDNFTDYSIEKESYYILSLDQIWCVKLTKRDCTTENI